jgi:hypothetical protein
MLIRRQLSVGKSVTFMGHHGTAIYASYADVIEVRSCDGTRAA